MNKFKWLYCGQGNYLFEVLSMIITYGVFKYLIYLYQWKLFINFEIAIIVLSIALGRIIFIGIDYILYNILNVCNEKYTLTSKMMSLGTSILLVFGFVVVLSLVHNNYSNIQEKTKDIKSNQIKLYIYKGKKPNGNKRLTYELTLDNFLYIQNKKNNISKKIDLSKIAQVTLQDYIKKFNNVLSIVNNGYGHPADINIDIRTSKNLIVLPLSNLQFVDLNEEEQKTILDFLNFIQKESNNSIDLNYQFTKENLESLKNE